MHFDNFMKAVRAGDSKLLNGEPKRLTRVTSMKLGKTEHGKTEPCRSFKLANQIVQTIFWSRQRRSTRSVRECAKMRRHTRVSSENSGNKQRPSSAKLANKEP